MAKIAAINGSPTEHSNTGLLLQHFVDRLQDDGWQSIHLALRDLSAQHLFQFRLDDPSISGAIDAVLEADAIVVATPVYKGAYTGLLKSFLDLLPHRALVDKSVLPIASGGTLAHYGVIDYALKPVLAALGASYTLPGIFVLDTDLKTPEGVKGLNEDIIKRLDNAHIALSRLHGLPVEANRANAVQVRQLGA